MHKIVLIELLSKSNELHGGHVVIAIDFVLEGQEVKVWVVFVPLHNHFLAVFVSVELVLVFGGASG